MIKNIKEKHSNIFKQLKTDSFCGLTMIERSKKTKNNGNLERKDEQNFQNQYKI